MTEKTNGAYWPVQSTDGVRLNMYNLLSTAATVKVEALELSMRLAKYQTHLLKALLIRLTEISNLANESVIAST